MLTAAEHSGYFRVLVVDDDADTVTSTAMVLQLMGHEVETARNGPDAITRTSVFQPHVALLDVGMPRMDGYEVARRIQQLVLPTPPTLVAITGYNDANLRLRSAEAGFDIVLTKPIDPNVFEQLHLLVGGVNQKLDRMHALLQRQNDLVAQLVLSHIQMGYSLLQVSNTTEMDATRDRCLSQALRICYRLRSWTAANPTLNHLRDDVDKLMGLLQEGRSADQGNPW